MIEPLPGVAVYVGVSILPGVPVPVGVNRVPIVGVDVTVGVVEGDDVRVGALVGSVDGV